MGLSWGYTVSIESSLGLVVAKSHLKGSNVEPPFWPVSMRIKSIARKVVKRLKNIKEMAVTLVRTQSHSCCLLSGNSPVYSLRNGKIRHSIWPLRLIAGDCWSRTDGRPKMFNLKFNAFNISPPPLPQLLGTHNVQNNWGFAPWSKFHFFGSVPPWPISWTIGYCPAMEPPKSEINSCFCGICVKCQGQIQEFAWRASVVSEGITELALQSQRSTE